MSAKLAAAQLGQTLTLTSDTGVQNVSTQKGKKTEMRMKKKGSSLRDEEMNANPEVK